MGAIAPLLQGGGVVATRLGPWLGRMAKISPNFLASLTSKLTAAGATVESGVSGIVKYFKSSPAAASLTLASIASVGVDVKDLFFGEDLDDDSQRFVDQLRLVANGGTARERAEAMGLVMAAGKESESADFGLKGGKTKRLAAIEVLSWAKAHYGSVASAARAHALHQAFFEMPFEDVNDGYQTLNVR